jgi:16S rRNA (uracil1498-N3)-methyltransferase
VTQRRIFLTPEDLCSEGVTFPHKTAHYLRNVLRLKSGDCVEVLAGEQQCVIRLSVSRSGVVRGEIVESRLAEPCILEELTLAFSCVRPGPVEEILMHGTELGVSRFVPILSFRSNRRPRDIKKRWESIIAAAAAQSRRIQMPELSSPLNFDDFLESTPASATKILLSAALDAEPMLAFLENSSPGEVTILVGPEGGLSENELSKAVDIGFRPVSLGPGVLRTETAAVVAAATVTMARHRASIRCRTREDGS